jgi:hypothetical protein
MSSPTCTCSSTIWLGTNVTTSSTFIYTCCPIILASKSPSFMTLRMPFADSIKAY